MKLRFILCFTLCLIVCLAAPSRIARQTHNPVPSQGNFASPQSHLNQVNKVNVASPSQFIPNGKFLPAVNPLTPLAVQTNSETSKTLQPVSVSNTNNKASKTSRQQLVPLPQQRPLSNVEGVAKTHALPTPQIVPPPVDRNVDLDGDGALSLAEVQYAAFVHHGLSSSVVENMFNLVDKNKDGYLTSIEFNEIRSLVLAKAENAALRYMNFVDTDRNGLLSLVEAQAYILKEYAISNRDVERIWRLVVPSTHDEMDAVMFSKLRRRVRGMSIRLARQIMKTADVNQDGHIDQHEAQMIAFEQEGIGSGDVIEMLASVDDNNDGELNAPEFADFQRIVRARAIETSKKALKVVDTDGSGTLTMDEAKRIAFDHYGFDERTLEPFFAQADENEDDNLDAIEFAGFRTVIRSRAVKNAQALLPEVDLDGDGFVSNLEAEEKARREDDMDAKETFNLFNVADQDKNGVLDKVELADFVRLVRLSSIKYASDHLREFDTNRDKKVTVDELQTLIEEKYNLDPAITRDFFDKVDVDFSNDLNPGEIVDFRHEVRKYVAERDARLEIEAQHRREMAEIEAKLRHEANLKNKATIADQESQETTKIEDSSNFVDFEEEDLEEEIDITTTTTVAPKKKHLVRKQKISKTTTVEPRSEEIEEAVHIKNKKKVNNFQSFTDDAETTVASLTRQSENKLKAAHRAASREVLNVSVENSEQLTTTGATITTVGEAIESFSDSTASKKKKKIKKLRLKPTTQVVEETTAPVELTPTYNPTTVEATTLFDVNDETTTEASKEIYTKLELTRRTKNKHATTTSPTFASVEKSITAEDVKQKTEFSDDEIIATTAKPKKRRLPKQQTTTTTTAPEEEYDETAEEEDVVEVTTPIAVQKKKKNA